MNRSTLVDGNQLTDLQFPWILCSVAEASIPQRNTSRKTEPPPKPTLHRNRSAPKLHSQLLW